MPLLPLLFALLALLMYGPDPAQASTLPDDTSGAAILAYFEVSDDPAAISAISPAQFVAQMDALQNSGAQIVPISTLLDAWKNGVALPPRSVAITFEGGYRSVLESAVPELKKRNWPYTIFIAPHQIARDKDRFMTWDELKDLQDDSKVSYGLLPNAYRSFGASTPDNFWAAVNSARAQFREDMDNQSPTLLAYPYGIPPQGGLSNLSRHGFAAGFGLQSGIAYAGAPLWLLPRFTMTQDISSEDRIRQLMQAAPFPANDLQPVGGRLAENPPAIGFTIPAELAARAKSTVCRAADGQTGTLQLITPTRAELRFANKLQGNRVRVNCTLVDGADDNGDTRYRWLGFLYEIPDKNTVLEETQAANGLLQDGGGLAP